MNPPKLQPALLGGAFIGVLSALPIISIGNACCCLWIVGGGVIAAFLMQQSHPDPISTGDGAAGGFLAGVVGAFVYAVVAIPIQWLMAPMQRQLARRVFDSARDIPPELRDLLQQVNVGALGMIVGVIVMLLIGTVFATAGGAIGALIFGRSRH